MRGEIPSTPLPFNFRPGGGGRGETLATLITSSLCTEEPTVEEIRELYQAHQAERNKAQERNYLLVFLLHINAIVSEAIDRTEYETVLDEHLENNHSKYLERTLAYHKTPITKLENAKVATFRNSHIPAVRRFVLDFITPVLQQSKQGGAHWNQSIQYTTNIDLNRGEENSSSWKSKIAIFLHDQEFVEFDTAVRRSRKKRKFDFRSACEKQPFLEQSEENEADVEFRREGLLRFSPA